MEYPDFTKDNVKKVRITGIKARIHYKNGQIEKATISHSNNNIVCLVDGRKIKIEHAK